MAIKTTDLRHIVDPRLTLEAMCEEWGSAQYCELAVLLSATRALAMIHQTNHWRASGETYYGDHLMLDRLYTAVVADVDRVAERLVGLASPDLVDPAVSASQMDRLLRESMGTVVRSNQDVLASSLFAETYYGDLVVVVVDALDRQRLLTYGADNLLADIADKHEEHVYLLKQRLG